MKLWNFLRPEYLQFNSSFFLILIPILLLHFPQFLIFPSGKRFILIMVTSLLLPPLFLLFLLPLSFRHFLFLIRCLFLLLLSLYMPAIHNNIIRDINILIISFYHIPVLQHPPLIYMPCHGLLTYFKQ